MELQFNSFSVLAASDIRKTAAVSYDLRQPSVVFGSSVAQPHPAKAETTHNVSVVTASEAGIVKAKGQRKGFGVLQNYYTESNRHCRER